MRVYFFAIEGNLGNEVPKKLKFGAATIFIALKDCTRYVSIKIRLVQSLWRVCFPYPMTIEWVLACANGEGAVVSGGGGGGGCGGSNTCSFEILFQK
jgi:hypothetical protein